MFSAIVGEADDGQDAVALARRERPDVVLMDIRMPRMGGIQSTQRLLARTLLISEATARRFVIDR